MAQLTAEDCDAIMTSGNGSLVQLLALELKQKIAENQKLRDQRDAANAQIQMLNSIIAGDVV